LGFRPESFAICDRYGSNWVGLPGELLYADDLVVRADSEEEVIRKLNVWRKVWK